MEILLVITSKADSSSREIKREVGGGLVIGRGAEDGILLEGVDLSREHLVLTADDRDIYVTDLSVNGTWLNGSRLRRAVRTRVRPEDSIEIPGYALAVQRVEELIAQPVAAAVLPVPTVDELDRQEPTGKKSGLMAILDPACQFIGSFTFVEKLMVLVGLCGLLLLGTYFGS
jgi:pSer/pThr/pTyr-binding forkhead associated (FHA) protein